MTATDPPEDPADVDYSWRWHDCAAKTTSGETCQRGAYASGPRWYCWQHRLDTMNPGSPRTPEVSA